MGVLARVSQRLLLWPIHTYDAYTTQLSAIVGTIGDCRQLSRVSIVGVNWPLQGTTLFLSTV